MPTLQLVLNLEKKKLPVYNSSVLIVRCGIMLNGWQRQIHQRQKQPRRLSGADQVAQPITLVPLALACTCTLHQLTHCHFYSAPAWIGQAWKKPGWWSGSEGLVLAQCPRFSPKHGVFRRLSGPNNFRSKRCAHHRLPMEILAVLRGGQRPSERAAPPRIICLPGSNTGPGDTCNRSFG